MNTNLPPEEQQKVDSFNAFLNQMPEFRAYEASLSAFLPERARYAGVEYPAFDERFSNAQGAYCDAMIDLIKALSRLPNANENKALCVTVRSLKFAVQEQIDLVTQ